MEQKSSVNKDLWFVCDKCGTEYDEFLEEIIPAEQIKGSIEWAYSSTSDKNKWDALEKLRIREEHENKERESEG
tara:strand:- start:763 stop:984 length:222 start_codon:yes stop_codon:yes gene_type:complete